MGGDIFRNELVVVVAPLNFLVCLAFESPRAHLSASAELGKRRRETFVVAALGRSSEAYRRSADFFNWEALMKARPSPQHRNRHTLKKQSQPSVRLWPQQLPPRQHAEQLVGMLHQLQLLHRLSNLVQEMVQATHLVLKLHLKLRHRHPLAPT